MSFLEGLREEVSGETIEEVSPEEVCTYLESISWPVSAWANAGRYWNGIWGKPAQSHCSYQTCPSIHARNSSI